MYTPVNVDVVGDSDHYSPVFEPMSPECVPSTPVTTRGRSTPDIILWSPVSAFNDRRDPSIYSPSIADHGCFEPEVARSQAEMEEELIKEVLEKINHVAIMTIATAVNTKKKAKGEAIAYADVKVVAC